MKYAIRMTRQQATLYLAAEFGVRGANRILHGVVPFGDSGASTSMVQQNGAWSEFDTSIFQSGGQHTKADAVSTMNRIAEFISLQEGRMGKALCGSTGVMRVVEMKGRR